MMVAYKTVIAPGEHYITSGVAAVSKLHRSQLQFKAELPLLTAGAPCFSLSVPPRYKKSIGFQIAEELAQLILNGHSSRTALSALVRSDEGNICGLWALTLNSDTGLQWGLNFQLSVVTLTVYQVRTDVMCLWKTLPQCDPSHWLYVFKFFLSGP